MPVRKPNGAGNGKRIGDAAIERAGQIEVGQVEPVDPAASQIRIVVGRHRIDDVDITRRINHIYSRITVA